MQAGEGRKGAALPSQFRRFADAATELEVDRLTDPASASALPEYRNRAISGNSSYLLYTSDCAGAVQVFGMNTRSGAATQLTEAAEIDASSPLLLPGDRAFCYAAGRAVSTVALSNLAERRLYSVPEPWSPVAGLAADSAGAQVLLVERQGERRRLRAIPITGGAARTVLESSAEISAPAPRLQRAQVLYRVRDEELWLAGTNGSGNRKLKTAPGRVGPAYWSPDGAKILYLSLPEDPSRLTEIREYSPETDADAFVAKTSQYAQFGFNRDSSVFVGASRSAASPVLAIMLRVNGRELTICEHRCSRAELTSPRFASDAQRVYFQSDRGGKMAIYCVPVERLVEKIAAERE
jgi:oligogalacturonide lyase